MTGTSSRLASFMIAAIFLGRARPNDHVGHVGVVAVGDFVVAERFEGVGVAVQDVSRAHDLPQLFDDRFGNGVVLRLGHDGIISGGSARGK